MFAAFWSVLNGYRLYMIVGLVWGTQPVELVLLTQHMSYGRHQSVMCVCVCGGGRL